MRTTARHALVVSIVGSLALAVSCSGSDEDSGEASVDPEAGTTRLVWDEGSWDEQDWD